MQDLEKAEDFIRAAHKPIQALAGQNLELSFHFQLLKGRHYGSVELGLSSSDGDSSIKFLLSRGDGEPAHRVTLLVTDANGVLTREEIAPNLNLRPWKLIVRYSIDNYARAVLINESGAQLWDTGEVPVYNQLLLDRIRLGVRASELSAINWEQDEKAIRLIGAASSPYMLDVSLAPINLKVW